MSNSGTAERQSDVEKVFLKAAVFVGLSGLRQVYKVRVVIPGQSYVMELDDIGSVRLVQKSADCFFLSLSNLE